MSYLLLSACGPAALIFDNKYLQNYFQKDVHKYLQNAHFQKDVLKYVHNYWIKYFQRDVLPGAVCMWTSSTCVVCPAVRACVLPACQHNWFEYFTIYNPWFSSILEL